MPIKLVAFDIEGTLTQGMVWQKLHVLGGVTPDEDEMWLAQYYNRKITFEHWMKKLIGERYKTSGRKRHEFEAVMQEVNVHPQALTTLQKLRHKYSLCLVSSAVDVFVHEVAKRLDIKDFHANYSFLYHANDSFRDINYLAPEDHAKVIFLRNLAQKKKLLPQEIVFVGDSSNDLEAFKYTQRGILVGKGNEKLKQAAWKQVDSLIEIESILL